MIKSKTLVLLFLFLSGLCPANASDSVDVYFHPASKIELSNQLKKRVGNYYKERISLSKVGDIDRLRLLFEKDYLKTFNDNIDENGITQFKQTLIADYKNIDRITITIEKYKNNKIYLRAACTGNNKACFGLIDVLIVRKKEIKLLQSDEVFTTNIYY